VAMIPHERTLVKRLADQPFTLLGINSDPADVYRSRRIEMEVTWPSFFDGGGRGGPIASQWGVSGWPTIYVLDHLGRIRYQDVREEDMDKAVDHLLAELRGELPSPSTESLLEATFAKREQSIPAMEKVPAMRAVRVGGDAPAAGGEAKTIPATPQIPPPAAKRPTNTGGG
jgi:hypothetical protein